MTIPVTSRDGSVVGFDESDGSHFVLDWVSETKTLFGDGEVIFLIALHETQTMKTPSSPSDLGVSSCRLLINTPTPIALNNHFIYEV